MPQTDINFSIDLAIESAEFLLQTTKCKQALENLKNISEMSKTLIQQDKTINKLLDRCVKASVSIRHYENIISEIKRCVGEIAWEKIIDELMLVKEREIL